MIPEIKNVFNEQIGEEWKQRFRIIVECLQEKLQRKETLSDFEMKVAEFVAIHYLSLSMAHLAEGKRAETKL